MRNANINKESIHYSVLNGAIGAKLHIPFPIAIRASYGYYFSYFCVISRAVLAAFWLGIQSVGGGSAVTQAIVAIWPSYEHIPNHLPPSARITTRDMASYVIFHAVQFPFLLIPMHRLQTLFLVKTIVTVPMAVGMLIWICEKAHNSNAILHQPATLSGSSRAWAWLASLTSITGGFSSLAVNIPDFSRFSKNEQAQLWQAPIIPALKIVTALFGIVATGAARIVYGQDLWSPLDLIAKWTGGGGRFLAFICSVIWIVTQICANMSANLVSFANDVTTMCPKWMNITRGTILCALIGGFAFVPWIIMVSATSFMSFMSGYAIFLAPMAGMLTCDYWILRRAKYDVPGLYDPHGRYRYVVCSQIMFLARLPDVIYFLLSHANIVSQAGVNWRAVVVMVVVLTPLLPGLANAVSPSTVRLGAGILNLYNINWLYAFHATIFLYWILNYVSPPRETFVSATIPGLPEEASIIEGIEGGTGSTEMDHEAKVPAKDVSVTGQEY